MGLQDELNAVSKTKEGAGKEQYKKDYDSGESQGRWCFDDIHKELLEIAKTGCYQILPNGKKKIKLDHEIKNPWVIGLLYKEEHFDYGKSIFNKYGYCGTYLCYKVDNRATYNGFCDTIYALCKEENVKVRIVGYFKEGDEEYEFNPTSGFKYNGFCVSIIKLLVRCSIEY